MSNNSVKEIDTRPFWKVLISLIISLTVTIAVVYFGLQFLQFFMPFVIGWFISYIASPLVNWLEKRVKIVRKISSVIIIVIVLAAIFTALYFAIAKIYREVIILVDNMPQIYTAAQHIAGDFIESLENIVKMLPGGLRESLSNFISNIGGYVTEAIQDFSVPTVTMAGNFAKRIPTVLIYTIISIMASYFFIAERENLIKWSRKVTPDPIVSRVSMIISNFKLAVGGYFKAQFKIMGVIFIILIIGFAILSVPYYILLAILIALLDFLPFFGTGTALIPWAIYQLIMEDYKMAIGLIILYGVTQLIRQVIQPKLVGDSMGLNPLVTLILLYIGYRLGSILGMILAVPIGMIVINLYKAGGFDYILYDAKIIVKKAMALRHSRSTDDDEDIQ
ncbi:MAG: sporulation integral membrane protein YtvI [Suipraeoptans sp.]